MRIAFISQHFFPEQFSNNTIAQWLVQKGHEVDVVCCVPNYPSGQFFDGYSNNTQREDTWNGVHIHRCHTIPRGNRKWQLALNYAAYPLTAAWTLSRKVRHKADVSFVSMPSPVLQALAGIWQKWRFGTPLVYWVQDIWPESATLNLNLKNPFIVKPLTWLCGWIYRRADLVLVQSAAFPKMITRFGVPEDRIRIFPNSAPEDHIPLNPDPTDQVGRMMPNAQFRLMFAGNIGESQDFDTYIATAKILKARGCDVAWVIVGSGRDETRVRREIAKRNLEDVFHFLGRHPQSEMPAFLSHADALLVGLKDYPIFRLTVPYKIQCYMACGRPIVASISGEGARVIADAGAGHVASAEAPEELANAIEKMVHLNATARQAIGAAGRAYFEAHYDTKLIFSNLEQWLIETANCKKLVIPPKISGVQK